MEEIEGKFRRMNVVDPVAIALLYSGVCKHEAPRSPNAGRAVCLVQNLAGVDIQGANPFQPLIGCDQFLAATLRWPAARGPECGAVDRSKHPRITLIGDGTLILV
jgi:hypothetical protein